MISSTRGPLDSVRTLTRRIRRAAVGALHPWRRKRALARLREKPGPTTILVVCHGNICRSPYGAGSLRRMLPPAALGVRVESAGFIGPHRSPPSVAIEVAAARGVDLRRHTSRVVSTAGVTGADLVVVMEPAQADQLRALGRTRRPVLVLGDLDPRRVVERTIRDPVEQPRQVFADSYDRIDRCLAELVNTIWGGWSG